MIGDAWLAASARENAHALGASADLDPLLRRIGDARVVLLGEATHGTSEFYRWRAAITERLVEEHGFGFVAVEGDWPDCRAVDRYVHGEGDDDPRRALAAFRRWPTWMWANEEVAELARWMRGWNEGHPQDAASFHGLDVYSLWDSMAEVLRYLDANDPGAAQVARQAYECFEPFEKDAQAYAASTRWVPSSCEEEVLGVLRHVAERAADFDATQNALVAANAEAYYRTMIRNDAESWNVRDTHMIDTLARLFGHHGPRSKAIVWEHNTHVGDARATDMALHGMVNVGQLARQRWGMDATFAVGFGTHRGTVIAGRAWDAPMEAVRVPPAIAGSWEDILHDATDGGDAYFLLRNGRLANEWHETRGHRAIGVVYDPRWERGNYVPTDLPARYDAFVFLDETHALHPLHAATEREREPPETFPSGL